MLLEQQYAGKTVWVDKNGELWDAQEGGSRIAGPVEPTAAGGGKQAQPARGGAERGKVCRVLVARRATRGPHGPPTPG